MKRKLVVALLMFVVALAACQDAAPTPPPATLPPVPVAETPGPDEQPDTADAQPADPTAAAQPEETVAPTPDAQTGAGAPATAEVEPAVETALSAETLANLTYSSAYTAEDSVTLVNGEYREQAPPGSAAETAVMLTEHVAYGEVNGRPVAAVVLVSDPGGSGSFYDLHLVGLEDGQPQEIASAFLGDRVEIHSMAIEAGQVVLEMVVAGPKDPLCCPTQEIVRTYELDEGALEPIAEVAMGNGPVGTGPALVNAYWHWTGRQGVGGDDQLTPANPERYVLLLHEDGSYQVEADCNRASGFFTAVPDGEVAFVPGMTSLDECGPDSLSTQMQEALPQIARYEVDVANGGLKLFWRDGSTVDSFRHAGTAVPLESGLQIDAEQISLDTQGLFASWTAAEIPARPLDSSGPPGPYGLPDHIEVYFDYENVAERDGGAIMYIIPVNDYIELWEIGGDDSMADRIDAVYDFARALPSPPPTSGVPVLPVKEVTGVNDLAVQIGRTGAGPASASETGYRFAGRFMQDANPVTNQGLRYIYQGFTNDGKYLVAFFSPVRTDELPDEVSDLPPETMEAFNTDPQAAISAEAQRLNALATSAWEPDLAALDALVNSLQIEGMAQSGLQNITWAWTGDVIDSTTGEVTTNALAGEYSALYGEDLVVSIISDCNLVSSTYEVTNPGMVGELLTQPPLNALADCGPQSLSQQFVSTLQAAQAYRVLPGGEEMILTVPGVTGEYRLRDAQAPAPEQNGAGEATGGETGDRSIEAAEEVREPQVQSGTVTELVERGFEMDVTGVASTFAWEVVPGTPIPDGPGGQGFPRHVMVTFDGEDPEQVLANNGRRLYIFPIQPYLDLYAGAGRSSVSEQVVRLQELIDTAQGRRELPQGTMPLLPPPNSLMDRWAQYRDYDFQSGMGARYLADSPFRQSVGVWGNDTTAYYYQGLSSDGKYYISLWWPVRTDALPDSFDAASAEVQRAANDPDTYAQYMQATGKVLNELPPEAFEPDLARLDAMIGTLKIGE